MSLSSKFRYLSYLVLGGFHALELLLLGSRLVLLNLLLIFLLKELTLRPLLQVSDLLKLDPVLTGTRECIQIRLNIYVCILWSFIRAS